MMLKTVSIQSVYLKGKRIKAFIKRHCWVAALIMLLEMFVNVGIFNNINGLYITPVSEALGISRGDFSFAFSAKALAGVLSVILSGPFLRRFGYKMVSLLLGLGSRTPNRRYWYWGNCYLYYADRYHICFRLETIIGRLCWLTAAMIPLLTASVFGYCTHKTINGILLAIPAVAGMIASPLTNVVFDKSGTYLPAFRGALILSVVILILHIVICFLVLRNKKRLVRCEKNLENTL